jgi:hypothetical protein
MLFDTTPEQEFFRSKPVESAAAAGRLLVTGRYAGRLAQVLVPAATPRVSTTPLRSPDLTRRFSRVTGKNCPRCRRRSP